jgi:hypothetical protein
MRERKQTKVRGFCFETKFTSSKVKQYRGEICFFVRNPLKTSLQAYNFTLSLSHSVAFLV